MMNQKALRKWIPLVLCVAAALAVLWFALGRDWMDGRRAEDTRQQTRELFYGQTSRAPAFPLIASAAAEEEAGAEPVPPLENPAGNFLALYAKNTDVVGWLKAGETIDYPVVQRDNEWYMTHNFFGQEDRNGTLFVNANNQLNPRDDVILIHGHNMKNGDMFGSLLDFREEAYMRAHPLVFFDEAYSKAQDCYVAVAGFDASMLPENKRYFDITQILFENDPGAAGVKPRQSSDFQRYLDEIAQRSYWKSPVEVTPDDPLLMLITCSYEQEDGRFVLVCRRLRDNETPEELLKQIQAVANP